MHLASCFQPFVFRVQKFEHLLFVVTVEQVNTVLVLPLHHNHGRNAGVMPHIPLDALVRQVVVPELLCVLKDRRYVLPIVNLQLAVVHVLPCLDAAMI